jgi:predicted HTH domain antitoxin
VRPSETVFAQWQDGGKIPLSLGKRTFVQGEKMMSQTMLSFPWVLQQLVKLRHQRPELVDTAISRLIEDDQELRWSLILNAYRDRQINLGKAAELLGMHELELRARFIQLGVPLRSGPSDLAEAQAEVDAIEAWFDAETADAAS